MDQGYNYFPLNVFSVWLLDAVLVGNVDSVIKQ